ncbi:asialoglycoprotein receptor 2-like isoform X1 [Alosa alosa]|uniref:asialoglycoprotein receptor 2-like isoform X1 n=1 Tax=Alosa alosa TaxID=278164 RepID=UPI0020152DE1|nr:asialoglycoprotein receptor 2-like isoform X1 [Alosa alosa]
MMEEEVCYSSVLFIKSKEAKPREEQNAQETVYAAVKRKEELRAEPSPSHTTADDPSLPGPHRYRCAVVVLGLLTAVLLSALVASLVYYQGYVSEYNTLLVRELRQLKDNHSSLMTELTLVQMNYANLSNSNGMLQDRYDNMSSANLDLQKERNTLMMERDHLNQTLEVIFQFNVFPVDDYCPVTDNATQERKCSANCKEGWVYYQSSCYLFVHKWNSWEDSKTDCEKERAHLVTIDTVEEQAFINNHTEYYYQGYGYWIGLRKIQDKWQWVDGRDLTGGHWIRTEGSGCVLSMPSTLDHLKSWRSDFCSGHNRWICEKQAVIWPGKNV